MTVAELIKALEKIEDKSLDVVADIGLNAFDQLKAETVEDVLEVVEYYGKAENGGWCSRTRKCVKIIG